MRTDASSGDGRRDREAAEADGESPSLAAARRKVSAYLRAFGDEARHNDDLTDDLLGRAVQRCAAGQDLVEAAVHEAESDLAAWSLHVLGNERVDDRSAILVARAAYQACGRSTGWPGVLLRYDLPDGFVDAMRAAAPPATPPERRGQMIVQPLETWSPVAVASPRLWNRLTGVFANIGRV